MRNDNTPTPHADTRIDFYLAITVIIVGILIAVTPVLTGPLVIGALILVTVLVVRGVHRIAKGR